MQARMEILIKLPIRIEKRQKWFLALCDVLDVVTQGETEELARKNIQEALYIFLRSCIERGTLDAVLLEESK